MNVEAGKQVYDSEGGMTEPEMDEWVQIGVFGEDPYGDGLGKPLHVKMHRLKSGKSQITVYVEEKPARAGIDPYQLLDWEEGSGDNLEEVKIE